MVLIFSKALAALIFCSICLFIYFLFFVGSLLRDPKNSSPKKISKESLQSTIASNVSFTHDIILTIS